MTKLLNKIDSHPKLAIAITIGVSVAIAGLSFLLWWPLFVYSFNYWF